MENLQNSFDLLDATFSRKNKDFPSNFSYVVGVCLLDPPEYI